MSQQWRMNRCIYALGEKGESSATDPLSIIKHSLGGIRQQSRHGGAGTRKSQNTHLETATHQFPFVIIHKVHNLIEVWSGSVDARSHGNQFILYFSYGRKQQYKQPTGKPI